MLGKEFISSGLKSGVFYKKDDGSVWCDLTEDGLDEKIVLRADGTAVYMTQDIGTAVQRVEDYPEISLDQKEEFINLDINSDEIVQSIKDKFE